MRYTAMFQKLAKTNRGAFVPFVTLGDLGFENSFQIIKCLIEHGADALELGMAFSDPVADGPVIQAANQRALAAGMNTDESFRILQKIRENFPKIPIGILTYANIVNAFGTDAFYQKAQEVGLDSILIADIPVRESDEVFAASQKHGIKQVFIAAVDTSDKDLQLIAERSLAYVYLVSRPGVTGVSTSELLPNSDLLHRLNKSQAAPTLLGFGISNTTQVKAAIQAGANGVICGSAIIKIIEQDQHNFPALLNNLGKFVEQMKAET